VVCLALVAIDQVQLLLEIEFFLNIQPFVVKEVLVIVLDFVYQKIQIQIEVVFSKEHVLMAKKNRTFINPL
jgi:hypothetical protein